MRICIFGSEEDKNVICDSLSQVPETDCRQVEIELYSDYDDLVYIGSGKKYNAVIVTADNATGMEGVIAAKKIFPQTPVIWLSNDSGFGTQSYRLRVAYFHTKPITAKVLQNALQKIFHTQSDLIWRKES